LFDVHFKALFNLALLTARPISLSKVLILLPVTDGRFVETGRVGTGRVVGVGLVVGEGRGFGSGLGMRSEN